MRNFVQAAKVVTVVAPGNVKSGDVVVVGRLCGIAATDALEDESLEIAIEGAFTVPLAGASAGDPVYWTGSALSGTGPGNTPVGIALTDSTTGGQTVVKFCPFPGAAIAGGG